MYSKNKGAARNMLALGLVMLAGVVVGSFIGEILTNVGSDVPALSFLRFLGYGYAFGLAPVKIELIAITLQFGVEIKFSICSVLFMLLSIFVYKRL